MLENEVRTTALTDRPRNGAAWARRTRQCARLNSSDLDTASSHPVENRHASGAISMPLSPFSITT